MDLLPDRAAARLPNWLREHHGVLVISRDRGGEYALGAQQGAPEAIQIADRLHVVLKLADVAQRILRHHRKQLKQIQLTSASAASPMLGVRLLRPVPEREKQHKRQERKARSESVRELSARGMTMQHIARPLHLDRKTVATCVHASTFPERTALSPRANRVTPYAPYLLTRWQEGARQTTGLWRELTARG